MNQTPNSGGSIDELRVLVVCDAGAMPAERALLARAVFPDVRRRCSERGVAFTDIDLLRRIARTPISTDRLLRSCEEEIRRNRPFIIGLVGHDGSEIGRHILTRVHELGEFAEPEMRRRAWFYARHDAVHDVRARALAEEIRQRGMRLREGWRDAEMLAEWTRDDLLAVVDALGHVRRRRPIDRERRAHEAFAASCRSGAVERPGLAAVLDAHAAAAGGPLAIIGPAGAGKSTLAAQWCARFRRSSPDVLVVAHHVGAAVNPERGVDVVRRIVEEIREDLGDSRDSRGGTNHVVAELPLELARAGDRRVVLLIDGVDQLAGGGLEWLPAFLPPNVRLVITSRALPAAAAAGGWAIHHLAPLTHNERLALGTRFSGSHDAAMERDHVAQVLGDRSIATPLALRVRLDEMRLMRSRGAHAGSAARFAAAADVDELMGRLLEHHEGEFGERSLRHLLTALAGTRMGMAQHELASFVECSALDLADMLAAFDLHLVRIDGRLRFQHDALLRAVEARYLAEPAQRRDLHRRLAALFDDPADARRCVEETPWHLRRAGDREALAACLVRPEMIRTFVALEREYEFVEHWMFAADADAMLAAFDAAVEAAARTSLDDRIELTLAVGSVLRHAGRNRDALRLMLGAVDLLAECAPGDEALGNEAPGEETLRGEALRGEALRGAVAAQLAPLLAAAGSLREAESWYRLAVGALRERNGGAHAQLARTMSDLGGVLSAAGRHAEAECEYRAALAMVEQIGASPMQTATAVNDLATVLHDAGRYDEAEALYRRALNLWRTCGGATHPDAVAGLSNLAALLYDRGNAAEARAARERVVACWEEALGPHHPMVATALNNLAEQVAADDPEAAGALARRALAIHDAAFPAPTHETAIFMYTLGRAHYYAHNLDDAERQMRRAYELQRDILGGDHTDTAVTVSGLATVLRDRGDYVVAEHLLQQSLETLRRALGPRHPRVAIMLTNLARLARRRGETDRARQLALSAQEMLLQEGAQPSAPARDVQRFLALLDGDGAGRSGLGDDSAMW